MGSRRPLIALVLGSYCIALGACGGRAVVSEGAAGATTAPSTAAGAGGSDEGHAGSAAIPSGGASTAGTASIGIGGSSPTIIAGAGGSLSVAGTGSLSAAGSGGVLQVSPLCASLITASGASPSKGVPCVAADPQFCFRTCGPESIGFKRETCVGGAYAEGACEYPADGDFSCYQIPAQPDPSCPAEPPQASTECEVAACTLCNANGMYLDSTGASKLGYCVCAFGVVASKWSGAPASTGPCPAGQGC